jgi:hypothetical protein
LWILLQATVRSGVYTLVAHPTINDPTFGYPTFKKLDRKFSNTFASGGPQSEPWIWIGM